MSEVQLYYTSASVVRTREMSADHILGSSETRGFFPARATLELNCRGDGWRVEASVANSPIEKEASKQKMIVALKTALAIVEASTP